MHSYTARGKFLKIIIECWKTLEWNVVVFCRSKVVKCPYEAWLVNLFGRVNSCVCFDNYKLFVLLVAYSSLFSLFLAATTLQYFVIFWIVSRPLCFD